MGKDLNRHFIKEEMQVAKSMQKDSQRHWSTWKLQIGPSTREHRTLARISIIKRLATPGAETHRVQPPQGLLMGT